MKFTFNNFRYEITFSRQRRRHQLVEGQLPSRLTTVRIVDVSNGKVYREATAACSVLDSFNYEAGRIAALRQVSRTLDKPFKAVMWATYINRPRGGK